MSLVHPNVERDTIMGEFYCSWSQQNSFALYTGLLYHRCSILLFIQSFPLWPAVKHTLKPCEEVSGFNFIKKKTHVIKKNNKASKEHTAV